MTEAQPDPPIEDALRGLHVLAVDDNADTAELTATLLELCGATVRTARSASEALALVPVWRPHVILSDLRMPGGDGYELAAGVRSLPGRLGSLPLFAITALGESSDRRQALAAGFTDFIVKPFDLLKLVTMLQPICLSSDRP